jgi:TM2 domain-containing membrane protein YozV/ribosomal protein L40E
MPVVSLTAGRPLKIYRHFLHIDGEVVDLQEANNINTNEFNETSIKTTEPAAPAAPAAIPVAAPVASESVPQSSKFCSECGAKISAKAEVCPKCGVRLATTVVSEHNKTTAALLALFLGGFGLHKFYLGRTGMGLIYLVFCWTLVPAFISLVEGIQFLSMSESEFAMKYR